MYTSTQGQAVWYGDIFQLPEGVADFLLDTTEEDPVLDSEDLSFFPSWGRDEKEDIVDYEELMNVQDFYVAEGLDMKEMYDE